MKNLIFFIPLFLIACNKKEAVSATNIDDNSNIAITETIAPSEIDSSAEGLVKLETTKPKTTSKAFRVIEGNKIIKTINADMIPLTVFDEFTEDDQEYILKIKNFYANKIEAKITATNSNMNIRFNQIKLADDTYDGPFGKEITYDISKPGEIWLIIGKSLMASGQVQGKFSVDLK